MKRLALSWIARVTGGRVLGEDRVVGAIVTDTRTLAPAARPPRPNPPGPAGEDAAGPLFVALKGANFDGHDHVAAAAAAGVAAVLVAHEVDSPLPQVLVADTERALGDLAAAVQRERATRVVAITGSNGKTTVKTLLLSILQRAGAAYANPGNRNNEIGLPLAVLDAPEDADFAVYEMGAGKPGDIGYLTRIARPDAALVNNIAPAHIERMGSLLGVADTKAAVYDALAAGGLAVINADDAFAPYFAERARGRRLLRFGLDASADLAARDIELLEAGCRFVLTSPQGEVAITLPLPGRHNVRNALAAAALALGLGVPLGTVAAGLNAAQPVAGRLVAHRLARGATLIDDSYNANPGSLAAAIDTLAAGAGAAWLVLGDMRELGEDASAMHAEAGRRARSAGVERLYALGPLSAAAAEAFGEGGAHFADHAGLTAALAADLDRAGAVRVLVKGSRGSAMDRIVTALLSNASPSNGAPSKRDTDAA